MNAGGDGGKRAAEVEQEFIQACRCSTYIHVINGLQLDFSAFGHDVHDLFQFYHKRPIVVTIPLVFICPPGFSAFHFHLVAVPHTRFHLTKRLAGAWLMFEGKG